MAIGTVQGKDHGTISAFQSIGGQKQWGIIPYPGQASTGSGRFCLPGASALAGRPRLWRPAGRTCTSVEQLPSLVIAVIVVIPASIAVLDVNLQDDDNALPCLRAQRAVRVIDKIVNAFGLLLARLF